MPATQQPAAPSALSFNPGQLLDLYSSGQHEKLADELLRVLDHFRTVQYSGLAADARYAVNAFCKHFLYLITQQDFVVDRARMMRFIALNHVIANVVAMSAFRTTDAWLAILLAQQQNFLKVLALYNPRCTTRIDRAALFRTDAAAASAWYFSFYQNYKTCPADENAFAHLREHLEYSDGITHQLDLSVHLAHEAYFSATYIDPNRDFVIKRHVNRILQAWQPLQAPIVNKPDRRKIAVLTSMWFRRHSVYRCMHSFLTRLAEDYELTLFHLGADNTEIDDSLFKGGVRRFKLTQTPDLSVFTPNDFALAFYPDIGMSVESVMLANVRIAPVQVCGYGHPVSTHGSKIDYWLGGQDVETVEAAERNYSERLVLIPGAGVAPLRPSAPKTGATPPADEIVIGCSWYAQKTNSPLLSLVERVLARVTRKVRFVMFPGGAPQANALLPFRETLARRLGAEHVSVHPNLPYERYMAELEACHFCLDPWPFGGYATVTDALWVGRPVVSIKGDRFFNRAGAHLLEAVGLDELVVESPDDYVDVTVKLVEDPDWLASLTAKLAAVDLDEAIFSEDSAGAFTRALSHLIDNHERLAASGDRSPILID